MRLTLAILLGLIIATSLSAQDGSNIRYYELAKLPGSIIGKTVQIDFYCRSFAGSWRHRGADNPLRDKVVLDIDGQPVEFYEHREDDGYNNWFQDQYLETADQKVRIKEFTVVRIDGDSITVVAHINVAPFNQEFRLAKKDIAEVLVHADQ